jgi:G3E family GTPase
MRLVLFSGFLGSGKTTLLLALARRLAAEGATSAVIVNEIGEVGIDGKVLGDGGLDVYEITAGCICCQIGVDLVRTLQDIAARYRPDVVMVEASGVATPAGIRDALTYYRGEAFAATVVVTVVDPTRFEALIEVLTPLIEAQIAGADEIVITKVDQATPAEVDEARSHVERLRPGAPVSLIAAPDPATLEVLLARLTVGVGTGAA